MKKVLIVLVLMMSVLVLNAQATQTTAKNTKSVTSAIKVVDLQKAISDHIGKNYAGYTIKEATSITKNEIMTYYVMGHPKTVPGGNKKIDFGLFKV